MPHLDAKEHVVSLAHTLDTQPLRTLRHYSMPMTTRARGSALRDSLSRYPIPLGVQAAFISPD